MQDANEIFEQTVRRAEKDVQQNPGAYKFRLFAFAMLGYVVIFGILIALFGLVAGITAVAFFNTVLFLILLKKKLLFVLIPAIWIMLKALWVRFEPPEGYRLQRKDYPELYAELDSLEKQLQTPPIHDVILTPELNASISQTPRLGVFGWYRNTLTLGLELLMTLSPEQARAVIAHELGHLSGNHSRFNGWIYRVRISWQRVMEAFHEQASFGAGIMRKFFDWYAPRFAGYSFALARVNEYEADAVSAELTSAKDAGDALINTHVTGPWIDEHYWAEYFRKADELPEPDHLPWEGLRGFLLRETADAQKLSESLKRVLDVKTEHADTHPALSDRLGALQVGAELPAPASVSAAERWLDKRYQTVLDDFDSQWLEYNAKGWRDRYDYVQEGRAELAKACEKSIEDMDDEALWSFGRLQSEFDTAEAAFATFQAYQARHPDDEDAAFVLGRMLYERDDEAMLAQMEKAATAPRHAIDAARYAWMFLDAHKRDDEKARWEAIAEKQSQIDVESEQERGTLHPKDELIPIELTAEQRQQIEEAIEKAGKIEKLWYAQKPMRHYPEVPAIALVIESAGWFDNNEKAAARFEDALELDCSFYVVPKGGDYKQLAKAIIKAGERLV